MPAAWQPAPMLATLDSELPATPGWVFEPKYDGIRVLGTVNGAYVELRSRNAIDRTNDFPEVADALRALAKRAGCRTLTLDGELVARTATGIGRFADLQQRSKLITQARHAAARATHRGESVHAAAEPPGVVLMVFDVLRMNTKLLLDEPWHERHERLEQIFRKAKRGEDHLQLVSYSTNGVEQLDEARAQGWEGIIAKQVDAVYEMGRRSRAWLKLKVEHEQEFVIGGYTDPRRSREHLGAILLGYYRQGELVYAGLCGGGFSHGDLAQVSRTLERLTIDRSPFAGPPPRTPQPAHWVKPILVAQIRFSEWTVEGKLRHPVFLGLRDDKTALTVHREGESMQKKKQPAQRKPSPQKTPARKPNVTFAGVDASLIGELQRIEREGGDGEVVVEGNVRFAVTHLDKVFFPKTAHARAYTKGDVFRHYVAMAPYILPAIADHPLVLRRFPNGINGKAFYQHRAPEDTPKGVRVDDVEAGGNVIPHLIGGALPAVLYAVQLGAISMDPWHSRVDSVDAPDYTIVDLDPGTKAPFAQVVEVAQTVKEVLDEFGLHGVPKTSGMTGIHVVLPLKRGTNEEAARLAAQLVAETVADRQSKLATVRREVRARSTGAVYVDYLQNIRGKTIASVYSLRPHPLAQVSMPLNWNEVNETLDPGMFTLASVMDRLAAVGDLWADGMQTRNDLTALAKRHS